MSVSCGSRHWIVVTWRAWWGMPSMNRWILKESLVASAPARRVQGSNSLAQPTARQSLHARTLSWRPGVGRSSKNPLGG
jgi:hypothetical protein